MHEMINVHETFYQEIIILYVACELLDGTQVKVQLQLLMSKQSMALHGGR